MLVTTIDILPNRSYEVLGIVRGNISFTKNIGRDIMASARNLVGGEVKSYTLMTNEARQSAEDRMVEAARSLGADAVVGVRFASESVSAGITDVLAYGTAVKLR
ncbi:MAG: YbjQ family protein [Coriobacteriales bacterium]|nr:YbjQ family protein [Coriobacteriales bacterium]